MHYVFLHHKIRPLRLLVCHGIKDHLMVIMGPLKFPQAIPAKRTVKHNGNIARLLGSGTARPPSPPTRARERRARRVTGPGD